MLMQRTNRLTAALLAAALLLTSCGGDDEADDAGPDPAPAESEPGDPAPAPDPAPAAEAQGEQRATVTIGDETIEFDLSEMCQNRGDTEMLALGRSIDDAWDFDLRYDLNEPDVETSEELLISNEAENIGWFFRVDSYGGVPNESGEVTWTKDGGTISGEATFVNVFSDQVETSVEGSFTISC